MADERAKALADQFIMDMHTHFLRDDTRLEGFVRSREAVGKAGWNPALAGKPQTLEDLKFANYFKEIFFDSDTKVALISGSGSEEPRDWFLTNEMKAEARAKVNRLAGIEAHVLPRDLHAGHAGLDGRRSTARSPSSSPTRSRATRSATTPTSDLARHPWRMDDEKLLYPFYEKLVKAGLVNVCVHKGLYPPSTTQQFPNLRRVCRRARRGQGREGLAAAQLRHLPLGLPLRRRRVGPTGWAQFEQTGRVDWVTDLAEIPAKYGVTNVYGDLGPDLRAEHGGRAAPVRGHDGQLVKGLGADHVVWGTDAVWTGSPQWQIEALRRLEIPEDMQKKHGFAPLGPADGPVKRAIFGENSARLYRYDRRAELSRDRIALAGTAYEREGPGGRTVATASWSTRSGRKGTGRLDRSGRRPTLI